LDEDDGLEFSVAFGANGLPAIAFRRHAEGFDPEGNFYVTDYLYIAVRGTDGEWSTDLVYGNEYTAGGRGCRLAFDDAGSGHIAHWDDFSDAVLYSTNASGAWITQEVARPSGEPEQRLGIAIDGEGAAHLCYVEPQGENVALIYASNPSGAWAAETIADEGNNNDCSLATDSRGRVFVAFYEQTQHILRVADNSTGHWRVQNLGRSGDTSSLALDSAGYVHVVLEDVGAGLSYAVSPESYGAPK
jgi:hypothetical protein